MTRRTTPAPTVTVPPPVGMLTTIQVANIPTGDDYLIDRIEKDSRQRHNNDRSR